MENISPPQSVQAALRVAEPVPTTKMLKKKKILKTNYFPLFEQFSKKAFEVMKWKHKIFLIKIWSLWSIQNPDIQTRKKYSFKRWNRKNGIKQTQNYKI